MKLFIAYGCEPKALEEMIDYQIQSILNKSSLNGLTFVDPDVKFEYCDTETNEKLYGAEALAKYILLHTNLSE